MRLPFHTTLLYGLVALSVGCSAEPDTTESDADGGTDNGLHSLDTCTTTIADDVPSFFKKYFRCVDVKKEGDTVTITSNNQPPHKSPYYPATDPNYTAFDTMNGTRRKNPNEIKAQTLTFKVPMSPVSRHLTITDEMVDGEATTSMDEYRPPMGAAQKTEFGMALDGVSMFHGVAAPGDHITDEQFTFDTYEAHPERTGDYHYHSSSPGPLEVLKKLGLTTSTTPGSASVEVYAIMCDGTVILGCTELDGSTPDDSNLDGQNGHVHDMKDEEGVTHFVQRYHTHVCKAKYKHTMFAPEIQYYSVCGAN